MALTFIGLLYVQIMYMNNMKKMRDDQFAEGVKRSLYAVSTRLEQDETKHFLEEDLATMETQFYPRTNADGSVGINYNSRRNQLRPDTQRQYRPAQHHSLDA